MLDEYHEKVVTVHLYFVGVGYLQFKYPHWLMEDCLDPYQRNCVISSA